MNKKLKYLTKISLNKKIKSKWFLVANIIIMILFISLINIDYIIKLFGGNFDEGINLIVVDNTNNIYDSFVETLNNNMSYLEDFTKDTNITEEKNIDSIKDNLKDNDILLVVDNDKDNYIKSTITSKKDIDTIFYQLISSSLNKIKTTAMLNKYGITDDILLDIEKEVVIEKNIIEEDSSSLTDMVLSVISPIVILPIFMLIMYLVQMIGSEINEEKSTKAMEIIISNVDPKTHFISKLLSSNLFVIIQSILLIIYTIIGGIIRFIVSGGSLLSGKGEFMGEVTSVLTKIDIVSKLDKIIPLGIIMIITTFIAYSLLAGILASMTTNMEDFQQLQTPITIISLLGFYLSLASSMFDGSVFIRIMSYVPFVSSFLSISLFTVGEITIIDVCISISIMIIVIFLLYKYGLKIYKVGILNYSSNNLWKKIFTAMKE